jgi:SDR family mycofactocin-dependent oxidoreductase
MTQALAGRVAFITGAARGQGRSEALRLAQEGADIIAIDRCEPFVTIPYKMPAYSDLEDTAKAVEALGRRVVIGKVDTRDVPAMQQVVDDGVAQFGRLDIIVANAGVYSFGPMSSLEISAERWADVVGTNLTGVFNTVKVAAPAMIRGNRGGSIILTSSSAGIRGLRTMADYTGSKHGVVGVMRTFANELAEYSIRVNSVHPTGVNTPMIVNPELEHWFAENPEMAANESNNLLPVELIEVDDVTEAVYWLASDASRYVTGVMLPVDAGFTQKV